LGCTIRGAGYSQSGQSVALDTVSLSTRRLDWIGPVDAERRVSVGAGVTPRQLLFHLRDTGLAPPVLPLNLDMTLGGLLSAGGVGPTSHRLGPVVANVASLDVVTGDGVLRCCSPERDADLFDAVRAGVGQAGLIVGAKLELVPSARRVRVFSYLYDNLGHWFEDQLVASDADAGLHIEGFCWASARGARSTPNGPVPFTHWVFGLNLGAGDDVSSAALDHLLPSLRPSRTFDEYSVDFHPFLNRYEPRFRGMVQDGNWSEAHPWFEAIVPLDRAEAVLLHILSLLPANVGDGHRFSILETRNCPRHFGSQSGARSAVIGVFPPAVARPALGRTLRSLEQLNAVTLEAKGRRYLSGWIAAEPREYLSAHFGTPADEWTVTRRRYDPSGVFRSALFTDGNRSS
jgi:cytokinin dehydrogenase